VTGAVSGEPRTPADRFVEANGIRLRYLDWPGGAPPLVLLHGLSANANSFVGLAAAGLAPRFRVVAPDLRGRGRSDAPPHGYRMADHAADVIGLLDALGLDRVTLGGHSFGAYLALYIAAQFPGRVDRLVLLDAAMRMNPQVREPIKPSLDRLGATYPSSAAYLDEMRRAPHVVGCWDWGLEGYFRAEIAELADGTARSATSAAAVAQALDGVVSEPWPAIVARAVQPALLVNAPGAYGPPGTPALVPEENARETAQALHHGRYVRVPGNHLTMLFGSNAHEVARAIQAFLEAAPAAAGA
jgi:pimeloyl-ACP methyl ester carboxylesterase